MMTAEERVHRGYAWAIGWTAVALVFSNFLMSLGAFAMLAAWAHDRLSLGPIFRKRSATFVQGSTVLLAVCALMAWQLLGMGWTEDLADGWTALRIKLPFLAFPLVLLTGRWDRERVMGWLPGWWGLAIVAAFGAILLRSAWSDVPMRGRDASPFISHIRFSLMMVWAWGLLTIRWLRGERGRWESPVLWGLVTLSTVGFIGISGTLTGLVLLPIVMAALVSWGALDRWGVRRARARRIVLVAGLVVGGVGLGLVWQLRPILPNPTTLESETAGGETYVHHPDRCLRENGHHVWIHLAPGELQRTWNRRSQIPFHGQDARNQQIQTTLIRYLTSLGLRKDSLGVMALSDEDVERIEAGIPTILELEHSGLRRRWDILQFEVDAMRSGMAPSGLSLTQRWVFWQAGWRIFQRSPAWGVGTGDLNRAFEAAYEDMDSGLAPAFRLRAHNQFLSFALAGGPVGAMLFLGVFIALVAVANRMESTVWSTSILLFTLIFFLSCWTEDTLETQAGVTWVGLFIGLFGRRP